MHTWIGIDPGGKNCYGVALLDENVRTFCVSSTDEAIAKVMAGLASAPAGVGIDAPLWWSSGPSSGRRADGWLRKRYGLASGTVQAPNSLRGAAIVQGAMFAFRIRELFPNAPITETHPKAVLNAFPNDVWERFTALYELHTKHVNEHERDAVIAAVAAREGFEGRWEGDLSKYLNANEQIPAEYWLKPIHYFWPEAPCEEAHSDFHAFPGWHKRTLAEIEEKVVAGKEVPLEWERAKRTIMDKLN
ncbi:MAG: DUF429 domain-containing protein [Candidatus Hydrogenedentes bacterium]|nr:DUF429 domain-containing protein [Candidatus Hydrogenedentota bacterium]